MESDLILQMDNHERINKALANFKKSPKVRITENYCQTRLESLETLWSNFTDMHKTFIKSYGAELKNTDYYENDVYDSTEETYIEYKTLLKTYLSKFNKEREQWADASEKSPQGTSKADSFKLPKIVIPTFSGKYSEWITFRDLFKSLIHNNAKLDNVQKMHYLKSSLSGEAEQLLRQIPISEANYERCWTQLESRYDNKRYLSHFILKRLLSQRNITTESASGLKELIDTTNDCLSGLANLGINTSNWDIIVIHILCLKLDSESRKQWEFNITDSTSSEELPTFEQFKEFLTNRYRALEFLDPKVISNKSFNNNPNNNSNHNHNFVKFKALHVTKSQCEFCSETHKLSMCRKFASQDVSQRRNFVQTSGLCYNCLGANHGAKACQNKLKCKLCHRRHHSLLHPTGTENYSPHTNGVNVESDGKDSSRGFGPKGEAGNAGKSSAFVACNFSTGNVNQVLLATALVNAESRNGSNQVLRALLDQGSQGNFVTESTVIDLKLKKSPIHGTISGLGGDKGLVSKAMVSFKIKSRSDPDKHFTIQAYVLKSITSFLPNRQVGQLDFAGLEEIELADPDYNRPNKIDLLLGAEVYSQVIQEGIRKTPNNTLVAQATSLGWILSGIVSSPVNQARSVVALHCQLHEGDELLKKFWEIESGMDLSKEQTYTEDERKCEEIFTKTTTRDEEGRYVVRLPFKTEDPDCKRGKTRDIAEKRLQSLERRFEKSEKFHKSYKEVIEEYIVLGHITEVQKPDVNRNESVYPPHHAVIREDKDTTKVRVVFHASQIGKNGVSLNDNLLVGPTIQPDLRYLIIQWRLSRICLTSDIVKMYRQIKVHEEDADFQRLLWRDESGDIKDYKHLRVTFGTASAPFLAVRTLQQVAIDEGTEYPIAAELVPQKFYMDDLMCGCEDVNEGMEIYGQMKGLLKKGGFQLQKWASNDEQLMKLIEKEEKKEEKKNGNQESKEGINIKMDEIMKILGLTWERRADNFRYKVNIPDLQLPITKRKIIADISRLFDPLGWITPCIILAKAMIQKLWITGIGWDEEVPKELMKEWCAYRNELMSITDVKIPRWVETRANDVKRELHGFCDASKIAYAAVVYLRIIDSDGKVHVTLIAAKSKVAPIKQVSIPRLELCGAVELTRLLIDVGRVLKIESSNVHAWTDSTIVLAWLNSLPSRWKVFVANRVSEILTSMNPYQWSHVKTSENPADCASRGVSPANLINQSMWFSGPGFLRSTKVEYKKPTEIETEMEAVKVHTLKKEENIFDIWEKFSSLTKLIRVLTYCRRFLNLKQSKSNQQYKGYLKSEELRETLKICIKKDQEIHFEKEIEAINKKVNIQKNSRLKSLNPILDENNILRVGGRLEEADLRENKKHPIIMAKHSSLTKLIIVDAHNQTLHGGPQLTLNYIRNKYFIIGAKQLIKAHVRKCVECVKNSGRTYQQLMGQLPSVRAKPARPFQHSGVDFAGPIQMRTARGRGHKSYKGYICLFVCMSTKAVHVEAVSDLTAQGFLQAFKRFVARRGRCEHIWSDNGTNFVGAATEIRKLFADEKDGILAEIAENLANNCTTWHFIPPHAPNFGGLWEAGVKSVKHHLKRVIGTSTLTFEEMATVLAQVEACLNSRPLSRLNEDAENLDVLTPGHFLVGEALVTAPDYNYETSNVTSLRRWQYTQRMSQEFWRKWSQDYLNQYFHRYRWSTEAPQPKIGDIVLVKEDGLPPCRWLYAKIIEEHPGRDGITRVVTLKCKNSIIKRSVNKLCILPVTE